MKDYPPRIRRYVWSAHVVHQPLLAFQSRINANNQLLLKFFNIALGLNVSDY